MIVENINCGTIPQEFTREFFTNILENGLNLRNFEIKKVSLKLGSSGGENYCSTIYRTKIQYIYDMNISGTCSVIIKHMSDKLSSDLLDLLFPKELDFYKNILPRMESLYNGEVKFGPKYFYHCQGTLPILVLEDLSDLNYEVADRIIGMNESQAKCVLEKIAKFHAASMFLQEQESDIFKNFDFYLFQRDENAEGKRKEARENMMHGNIKHLIRKFEKYSEFETIIPKLKNLTAENMFEKNNEILKRPDSIKVLIHGDMWVNNVLIRNESEHEVEDAVFVDFQLCYNGSLGLDLQYFTNTSLQVDQHKKRFELVEFYAKHLIEALNQLNFKGNIPTTEDILNEYDACQIIGFMAAQVILLVVSIDRDEAKDNSFETFLDRDKVERQFMNVLSKNTRVINILESTLRRCKELNTFD